MTVGEFKKCLEADRNISDDTPIQLCDLSTDDPEDSGYVISEESLAVVNCTNEESGAQTKVLFITFDNKLNPNPI